MRSGALVAVDPSRLAKRLAQPLAENVFGEIQLGEAWTGTLADGGASGDDCEGWTTADAGSRALRGTVGETDPRWTQGTLAVCSLGTARLYCFQR